ncbi:MAG: alpha/beta hydrolase [Desulfobacca sp.]|nr:alpha/beta hydrolase [Desulfobacca sp.]
MPNVKANGIQIEYETFGNPSGRPLLLIIGLGGQMIQWDDDLCKDLANRGHFVIRFDNRDSGLSTKFEEAGVPDLMEVFGKIFQGEKIKPAYSLDDMADDAVGLLDAIGIQKAHICGMSMGGMIAQTIAIRHPSRVLSLISIYSTTGHPEIPQPKPEVMGLLITPPPSGREANIEHMLKVFKTLNGPGFPLDEKWTRRILAESYDRCFYPHGVGRQLVAILSQGNRRRALAQVNVPTLVVHGTDDPLVPVEGGKDTARVIPGAQLILIEGMGHDLPHGGAWPQIVEVITAHTQKVTS